jgi:hypothetical protein
MTVNIKTDVAANGQVTFFLPASFGGQQVDVQVKSTAASPIEPSNEELVAERQRQIVALKKAYGVFADTDFKMPDDPPADQDVTFE